MNPLVKSTIKAIWEETIKKEYDFIESLKNEFSSKCQYLEIGCGSLGLLNRLDGKLQDIYQNSIGIDIDKEKLDNNRQIKYPVCSSCYFLPLKSESVDIIVCRWLFEHLEFPDSAMREMNRVLKNDGYLYLTTPNLLNYAMLISKFTPTWFHNSIRTAGGGHENTDTFYRANSKRRLKQLALRNKFIIQYIEITPYSFMYYKFNKVLFFRMKKISELISHITHALHLKITCLMKKEYD